MASTWSSTTSRKLGASCEIAASTSEKSPTRAQRAGRRRALKVFTQKEFDTFNDPAAALQAVIDDALSEILGRGQRTSSAPGVSIGSPFAMCLVAWRSGR